MVGVLLTDVGEILSGGEVIKHNGSSYLIEELLFEILALVEQFLYGLWFLREHVLLSLIKVISHLVNFFHEGGISNLPLLVVLLFE